MDKIAEIRRLQERYPDAQTFKFGDNQKLCDELLALVRSGKKTAPAARLGISIAEPKQCQSLDDGTLPWIGTICRRW